jgi:murein DD-endopeptidase MepM/ murein hydrolase activator NlpD
LHLRLLALLAMLAATLAPAAAQASALQLRMDESSTLTRIGSHGGAAVYRQLGVHARQTFLVQVLDDAGVPVAGCLGAGAAVEVVTAKGTIVGSGTCAQPAGTLAIAATTLVEPDSVYARIVAASTPAGGNAVSPVQSAPIVLRIAPKLTDTTSSRGRDGKPHRITGTVGLPHATGKGTVVLERREGRRWSKVGSRRPTRGGTYAFRSPITVRGARLRVRFQPRNPERWLPASYELASPLEISLPLARHTIGGLAKLRAPHHCCHAGVDLAAPPGTPIYSVEPGRVVVAGAASGYGGHAVVVVGEDGWRWLYGHGSAHYVRVGQTVEAGTLLGRVGSEGYSTGPHLHVSLMAPSDPAFSAGVCSQPWLAAVWHNAAPPAKSTLSRTSCIGGPL